MAGDAKKPRRYHCTVTMQEELLRQVQRHCTELDVPLTVWCRDAIKQVLQEQRAEQRWQAMTQQR